MSIACEDLKLDSLEVVHAGPETFRITAGLRAVSAKRLLLDVEPLKRQA
jgi:hypothetical protein